MLAHAPQRGVMVRRDVTPDDVRDRLLRDVRDGLTGSPPALPSYLLYMGDGGRRFVDVAGDPRYRLARRERALLNRHAAALMAIAAPEHLLELGGGASDKLDLLAGAAPGPLLVSAVDVDEPGVVAGLERLARARAAVESCEAIVGDMLDPGTELPRRGRRLVVLLGSTFGNFDTATRAQLLDKIAQSSAPGDALLLGLDMNARAFDQLAAYSAESIARFNREAFSTLGALLGAPLSRDDVDHRVTWDEREQSVRVQLVPHRDVAVRAADGSLDVRLRGGVPITTAASRKFTVAGVEQDLASAGFDRTTWWLADSGLHALVLARRSGALGN